METKNEREMQLLSKKKYSNKLETISLDDEDSDEKHDNLTKNTDRDNSEAPPEDRVKIEKSLNNDVSYIFKLILVGDTNTGKTTICNTLIGRNIKTMQYQPTIGIDFNSLVKRLYNNEKVKVQIWDTAGQEKYRSIITSYFRNISSAIITYDVTNRTSFMRVINWIQELHKFNTCRHAYYHPILLLGTKSDLNKNRKVSFDEGFQFSQANGLIFREINSFVLEGPLETGFIELLQTVYSIVESEERENLSRIPIAEPVLSLTANQSKSTANQTPNQTANTETLRIHTEPTAEIVEPNSLSLITCKGVKSMKAERNSNKINLSVNSPTKYESPKLCSKCVIC